MKSGLYIFTNNVNSKKYVGQSKDIKKRIKQHFMLAETPSKNRFDQLIHRSIRKYGKENFSYETIECDFNNLDQSEINLIKELNCVSPNGYNIEHGGYGQKRLNEETKEKISNSRKGNKNPNFGKPRSKDVCLKISEAQKGNKNHRFGKTNTKEHNEKISKALIGTIKTEEHKKKLATSQLGKKVSKETKEKISKKLLGRELTNEHKKNISKNQGVKLGESNHFCKITEKDAIKIKKLLSENFKISEIADILIISKDIVYNIKTGRSWKHI